ncbi:MAG TPA: hypothetical protein VME40_07950, partial [Caulobacteraceae bacterium]|nr:hypothetical protein [Caulobacteraceae bacterium]
MKDVKERAKDRAKERVTLNPLVIQKWAAPATGQVEVFDTKATMLALRVAAGGTRTLGVRARIKGLKGPDGKPAAPVRVTLRTLRPGQLLEDGELAAVRREAWEVWEKCQNGQDPREAEKSGAGAVTLRQA